MNVIPGQGEVIPSGTHPHVAQVPAGLARGGAISAVRGVLRSPVGGLATAAVVLAMVARFGASWQLPAFLYLGVVGVALAVIDLHSKRLPNTLTLPSYPILAGLLLLPAALIPAWGDYARALAGGVLLGGFYLLLALAVPSGMGMGDVKLAGVLGMALGWIGWGALAAGGLLGFFYGSVVGIVLLVTGRAGRRDVIPFGPYMLGGVLTAIMAGIWIPM